MTGDASRVAVITDIHANLPALQAALGRIDKLGHRPRLGSVGKPKDGDPRGAFAILTGRPHRLDVTIERVAYDAQAVADEVAAAGLPEEFATKLVLAA